MGRSGSASKQSLGIVIPTVGQRPELRRMLLSIAAQTVPVEAIRIVVDSDDTSLVEQIVIDLSDDLGSIDVEVDSTGVHRAEGVYLVDEAGHGFAMHLGVAKLDTDLVAFLDDDDEILPQHYEHLIEALDPDAGVGVAYSRVAVVTSDGRRKLRPGGDLPAGKMSAAVIIDRQPALLPASIIHRSVLDVVENVDDSFDRLADTEMLVRLGAVTRFAAVDDPTYIYYRVDKKALINERVLTETARLLKKHEGLLSKRERILFWDTQTRQALRAGFDDLGRYAAGQVLRAMLPVVPKLFVAWYVWLRRRQTPEYLKRVAARVVGPKSAPR
jgi:glycosyltransferase involved in cell wall biosynthesis